MDLCGEQPRHVLSTDPLTAARLSAIYGANPQEIGVEDGTEDDYGDLLSEIADVIGVRLEDDERWSRLQTAAEEFDGTTIEGLIEHLREATA